MAVTKLKYVVTGTGRSGTVYMARLLSSVGIPCGHESVFDRDGLPGALARLRGETRMYNSFISTRVEPEWIGDYGTLEADSSYMVAPFLDDPVLDGCTVIHAVRHPLRVINSFVNVFNYFTEPDPEVLNEAVCPGKSWQLFIYHHIPELRQRMTTHERAALYYVRWNQMIEAKCRQRTTIRHRVEDSPESLFESLGIEPKDYYRNTAANHLNTESRLVDHIPMTWVKRELIGLAERYGYHFVNTCML